MGDLEFLEEARDTIVKTEEQRDSVQAAMVNIYEQSKDPFIERKRRELEDALKFQDFDKIKEIQAQVQKYSLSPGYVSNMAKKIKTQVNSTQADKFLRRQSRLKGVIDSGR